MRASTTSPRLAAFLRSLTIAGPAALALLVLLPRSGRSQAIWVSHGAAPSTQGQVENITDREVVGAIHAVAAHPTDPDILYIGAVNGGIWKTTDATATSPEWTSQLGLGQALSIGAIAFDPGDATHETLMAGSGRFSSYGRAGSARVGIWHTTDGGGTWTRMDGGGAIAGLNISGVAPRDTVLVVSANQADIFGDRGVWRSTDTGGTWTRISGSPGSGLPAGAAYDLASDPSDPARLYTNAGSDGVYATDDTAATWNKVSDAVVDGVLGATTNNVEIAVGTGGHVFVAVVNGGQLAGLFRSPDGNAPWTSLDLPTTTETTGTVGIHPGSQGGVHLSIGADPTDANIVYVGGDRQPVPSPNSIGASDYSGRLFRVDASQPSGSQAAAITHVNTTSNSAPHADSRDMAFDANDDLVETDDGGVYRRTSPLLNTGDWFSVNGNLAVAEYHDIAWDSNAKVLIAGAQDNGTPEQELPGDRRWRNVTNGDGGDVVVDDFGTPGISVRYSSYYGLGGFRRRTYDASNTFSSQDFPALTVVGGGSPLTTQFTTPIALNAVDPTRLVIGGGNSVYESSDQGDNITEIGPGIVTNAFGREAIAYGATGNADMLYVGSGDSVFVRTGAPPTGLASSPTYPGSGTGRWVAGIVMDPADPQTAFVVDGTTVYTTPDAGGMWTDITGDLMTLAPGRLRSIAYSTSNPDGSLIVGADNGAFIAPGPTFDAWGPVGTGLPRAPVFDLEYDAEDETVVAGVLGRGAWAASLAERDPVDVALSLDLSGSMLSPACPTCDPKLEVLKDAVEIFVQLWTVLAIDGDRLGVNYFRTDVSELMVSGDALFPVLGNAATTISDVQGQTTTITNLTAMGGGIQTAIDRMTDATRPRNVILFTDGMQNVNPMVDATTLVIDDVAGRPDSNVDPTVPPTDLNAALDINVNTIGVGATPAFVDLLDDIATDTDGLFKVTTAPDDDLRRFYVEELVDVLRVFSPQLVDYRYGALSGDAVTETFTTNASARRIVFKLSWERGEQFGLSVSKDGVEVTPAAEVISGPFYRIVAVDVPTTFRRRRITPGGAWRLTIEGEPGSQYEVAAIADDAAFDYDFAVAEDEGLRAGDVLPLDVVLRFGGLPVTDARVTATVLAPRRSLATLLSIRPAPAEPEGFQYESGASAAQRKLQLLLGREAFHDALEPVREPVELRHAGNGRYEGTFEGTTLTGPYTVVFEVEGERADIGPYRRTESLSVTVRFGAADLAASGLRLIPGRLTEAGRRYELHLRPRDRFGNYLGPDYGSAIEVSVSGGTVTRTPEDRLDGSYRIPFNAPSGDPEITVRVADGPLYSGPLSGIPTTPRARFALSAHGGGAIPATGFPSAASAGALAEIDLEYRVSPRFSLEAVAGRYDFGSPGEIVGGSVQAKGYRPTAAGRVYGAAGAGIFRDIADDTEVGAVVGAGLNRPLSGRIELDLGATYTHLFAGGGVGFLGLRAGLKATF